MLTQKLAVAKYLIFSLQDVLVSVLNTILILVL